METFEVKKAGDGSSTGMIHTIFEPFFEFWTAFTISLRPKVLAEFIQSGRANSRLYIKYYLGALLITFLIQYFAPPQVRFFWGDITDAPFLNEFFSVCLYFMASCFASILIHPGLRLGGGHGSFKQTLLTILFVSTAFIPVIILLRVVVLGLTGVLLGTGLITQLPEFILGMLTLARIHNLSKIKTAAISIGCAMVGGVVLGVLLAIFFPD